MGKYVTLAERLARKRARDAKGASGQGGGGTNADEPTAKQQYGEGNFVRVGNEVFEAGLKANELAVYIAIASFAHDINACFPSVASLARRAGLCKRSTQAALDRLEQKGAIARRNREGGRGPSGKGRSCIYRLCLDSRLRRGAPEGNDVQIAFARQVGVK